MKTYLVFFVIAIMAIVGLSGCAIGVGLMSGGNILGDWKEFHYKVENLSDQEVKIVMHSVNASREVILPPSGSDKGWFSVINRDQRNQERVQIIMQFYVLNEYGDWRLVTSDSKDPRDGRITLITWYGAKEKKMYKIIS